MNQLIFVFLCLYLAACKNPFGDATPADSLFGMQDDSDQVDVVPPDFIDDDDSALGFGGAVHEGTQYSLGVLSLEADKNLAQLDSSWAPKWNSLVGHWSFEQSSWSGAVGEVEDSVGTGHGFAVGDATPTADSKIGSYAGSFDGLNDFINLDSALPAIGGLNGGTLVAWVKSTSSGRNDIFSISQGAVNTDFSIWRLGDASSQFGSSECMGFVVKKSGSRRLAMFYTGPGNSALSDGAWHHVAVVVGAGANTMYVDGVDVSADITYLDGDQSTSFFTNIVTPDAARVGGLRYNGSEYTTDYNGQIDELAMWDVPLSADEIALIYSRQSAKFSGQMKARVMDSKSTSFEWTNLDWTTVLPFGKELPSGEGAANSESSESYSQLLGSTESLGDDDLMAELIALWHMNETGAGSAPGGSDFVDSSGAGFHGRQEGGVQFGATGRFDKAAVFDGVDDRIVVDNLPLGEEGTISLWVKDLDIQDTNYLFDSSMGARYLLYRRSGNEWGLFLGQQPIVSSGLVGLVDEREWTHIAVTYDSSHPSKKEIVYKNGVEFDSFNVDFTGSTPSKFYIGSRYADTQHWHGQLDEFGVWGRALAPKEVLQLYRRGANRIKFQVRACSEKDCTDQEAIVPGGGWRGPGGNYLSYFSEAYNHSSISSVCSVAQSCYQRELILAGNPLLESPSLYFNSFGANGISTINSPYFQYRAILESDDKNSSCESGTQSCLPSLINVKINQ